MTTSRLAGLTESAINHHVKAVSNATPGDQASLDEILDDYSENARIFAPDGVYTGKAELRRFFESFLSGPDGMRQAFRITRLEVRDDIGYMLWSAEPYVPFGANTFVVRNGQIAVQTFGPYLQQ